MACLPLIWLTCVDSHCRSSSLRTAVLHIYMLCVCRLCRWLHTYALLLCHLHCRPVLARIAELCCYPLLSYIHTCCLSAVNMIDPSGYALQNLVAMHHYPTFLHTVCLPPLLLATSVCTARLLSTSSTCIRLQSFFGTHCYPTFVRAAHLLSTSLPYVDTYCRTYSLCTAVLYSYILYICCLYHWLHLYTLHVCHHIVDLHSLEELLWYPLLSYICTRCSYAVNITDLRLCVAEPHWYLLLSYIHTHCLYAVNIVNLCSHAL